MYFTSRKSARFSKQILEKNHSVVLEGVGERNHFEIHQSILFLARPDFSGTIYLKMNLLGNYQSLTDMGKGKTQLQPTQAICPTQRGRGKNWERLLLCTVQRHQPSKKLRLNHMNAEHFLSPHTSTHYIIAVPFTWCIISSYPKKCQKQKTQFEKPE